MQKETGSGSERSRELQFETILTGFGAELHLRTVH
jgi:hypothetical protein